MDGSYRRLCEFNAMLSAVGIDTSERYLADQARDEQRMVKESKLAGEDAVFLMHRGVWHVHCRRYCARHGIDVDTLMEG